VVVPVGIEAAWRAARQAPSAIWAGRFEALLLLVLAVTIAGGLGLVAGGGGPREALHFVYAVLAIGALPVASSLTQRAGPRARALATLAATLVILIVIARLFGTG
jgi:hypothetical protein